MISNSNPKDRINSWKIFQKWVNRLSNQQVEIVLTEMLNAPISSVITAGLQLLKDLISKSTDSEIIKTPFYDSIISQKLLNINSSIYSLDSDHIMNNNELFKDRIKVISHILNLLKFLKMKNLIELSKISLNLQNLGNCIQKCCQNDESLECHLLIFNLNELLA